MRKNSGRLDFRVNAKQFLPSKSFNFDNNGDKHMIRRNLISLAAMATLATALP